jgi:hypothetical protein
MKKILVGLMVAVFVVSGMPFMGHFDVITRIVNAADKLVIDDFEGEEVANQLGNKTNVFVKAPSRIMMSKRQDTIEGNATNVLMLHYDKQNEGGPYGTGGWCGYYTLLKSPATLVAPSEGEAVPQQAEDNYFDASGYKALTFWVKGEKGGENFMVGLADRHWDKIGDSLKSEEIGKYLPAGKITTNWQKATIPLDVFFLDYGKLSSVAISFESDCFPEGKGEGVIFVDDIALE